MPASEVEESTEPSPLMDDGIHVQLTYSSIDIRAIIATVKRQEAGAVVTFTGSSPRGSLSVRHSI
jgi:hypothetical protein